MALKRVAIPSPNYSSRGGAGVRLIVMHTAEGSRTYQSLGSYFQNPSSGVSSHVGIDDTANTVGEYVQRSGKAWTASNANPVAVQAELCAFAAWDNAEWHRHPNMLSNAAAWIREESQAFGIPLVRLNASQAPPLVPHLLQPERLHHSPCHPATTTGLLQDRPSQCQVSTHPTVGRTERQDSSSGRHRWQPEAGRSVLMGSTVIRLLE